MADSTGVSAQLDASSLCSCSCYDLPPVADSPQQQQQQEPDAAAAVINNCNSAAAAGGSGGGKRSVSEAVRRKIRQLYRSFGRADASNNDGFSASAVAASAVAAAAAAAAAPTPDRQRKQCSSSLGDEAEVGDGATATNNSCERPQPPAQQQQQQRIDQRQANSNNDLKAVQPMIRPAGADAQGDDDKPDDLYTVLTVDAEELKNFYSGIYVVAQCEGVRLKTKRTNKLDDIQTSFIFYRKDPSNTPIEFKMYANHLTLRRRVLIGELSMTLQPGEPFDGMSVRRSIRERPELRQKGGSGLLFNFMSGMLHTQHLSGV